MRAHNIATLALLLLVSPAVAATRAIDGDTIEIDGVQIRLIEPDTPELSRPRCANELMLGLKAKARLQVLLDGGAVTFTATGTDRYGRVLAHVYAGEINVGEKLIEEGYALRWKPGTQAKAARRAIWCAP